MKLYKNLINKNININMEKKLTKEHLNIVFIGHVDAGKSTLCGQVLFSMGEVDSRTIEKYEKEAKEKNRDSWFLAYIMDTNEEEREKGKTVEIGKANFETEHKKITILDAPGHKNYIPNMISGACQADVAVLVLSARKGEFETGFDKGGQTREHLLLTRTLGVTYLIVVINKMDDPTVNWCQNRYQECQDKLSIFLKSIGFNISQVKFIPISGLKCQNINKVVDNVSWWKESNLIDVIDSLSLIKRNTEGNFRMPILNRYRDMGTIIEGKIEQGKLSLGDKLLLLPNKIEVEILNIWLDDQELTSSKCGDNIRIKIKEIEEDIKPGYMLSSKINTCPVVNKFVASLIIVELLEHKPIFTIGYESIIHIQASSENCSLTKINCTIDRKNKQILKKNPKFARNNEIIECIIEVENSICLETFENNPRLGRFTLRDEGKTIAIGKIISF